MRIDVRTEKGGVRISFEYDKDAVSFLKKSFPKARFDYDASEWVLSGRTALSRVNNWLPAFREHMRGINDQDYQAKLKYGSDRLADECEFLTKTDKGWTIDVAYNPILFTVLKKIPGGRFDRLENGDAGPWHFPFRATEKIREYLTEITVLGAIARKQQEERDALDEERKAEIADRRAEKKAAAAEERAAFAARSAARREEWIRKKAESSLKGWRDA